MTDNPFNNNSSNINRPRRPMPETTDGKLEEIIRRLGHIEKHLIDLKGNLPPPGRLSYQREVDHF